MSKKWILFIFAALFLLLLAVQLVLQSGLFSEKAKEYAEKGLERLLGRPIQIGEVELRSLSASVVLKGVSARPTGDVSPFSAQEIRVYFSPWSLLTQSFFIRQIVIESPAIMLTPAFLPQTPPPSPEQREGSPPAVVVRTVRIKNGSLSYQGAGLLRSLSLQEIEAEIRPDLGMTRFEIDLAAAKGRISTEKEERTIDRLETKVALIPGEVEIRQGSLTSGRAHLLTEGKVHTGEDNRLDLQIDLRFPLEEAPVALITERKLSGEAIVQGQLTGAYPNLAAAGKITLPQLSSEGAEIGSLLSEISYRDRKVVVSSFSGELFKGTFSGEAEGDFMEETPTYRASLQYGRLPLEKTRKLLSNLPSEMDRALEGIFLDGDFSISGKGAAPADWAGGGRLEAKRLPLFSPPFRADAGRTQKLIALLQGGVLQWRWSESRLSIDQGRLAFPNAEATFHGNWSRQQGLSIEAAALSEEVRGLTRALDFPFTGALQVEGTLSGEIDHPRVEGHALLDRWTFQGKAMGTLSSQFLLQDRRLLLKEGSLESPPTGKKSASAPYRFDGSIQWAHPEAPMFDLQAKIASADPQAVFDFFKLSIPLRTAATGTLTIKGSPRAFAVKGPLRLTRGSLYGERFDRGRVDLTVTNEEVQLRKVSLERGTVRIAGEGEIRFNGTYRIAAKGAHLPIHEIEIIQLRAPLLSGKMGLEVTGEGSFKKPNLLIVASVQDLRYADTEGDSGTVKVDWSQGAVRLEGAFPKKNFSAKGEIQLTPSYPFSFQGRFAQLRIDPFIRQFFSTPLAGITLQMTGELEGGGQLTKMDQVNLTGSLTEIAADFGGYAVGNDGPIAVRSEGGAFAFENARLKGENTALEFNGGLIPLQSWDLFVKGEADLNLLTFFSRTITSGKGKATLDVRISDQWKSPRILGQLALQDGTVRTVIFPQSVHVSSLSVVFNERVLLLETFEGEMGRGRFQANGKADLAGFGVGPFGFLLEVADTRINLARDLTATVDGELLFQREGSAQTLKGELIVKRAIYDKRVDLKSVAVEWAQKTEETFSKETPFIGATKMNIHLSGEENLWIDNNLAKIPLEADLFLKGTLDRPLLIGRIVVPRGLIYFRNNEFEVTSGSVEFLDPQKINPRFNLKAKTVVETRNSKESLDKDYEIDLGLTGTLSQFTLALSSSPPLPETDILALLTFGVTTEEFAQRQGGVASSEATSLILAEFLEGTVPKTGFVDRIQVDPFAGGSKSSSGPRLTAEKRLLEDRLLVTYEANLDPSQEQLIRMIYELGKNVSLVGERDQDGQMGGDVRFRFEFR
ncbi:translocation/assembly module TamB domain-containing protein [Candidatus Manganitrophus noduliformans]|uniref:Translocation/assembly module TamB n=1 Tax=Candidatus Manganitrophus noduliformans TaxID=2606439 RepID=A0A7X6DLG6_9BACT|nr:translocation/assembly module TamB domain-containing protein [Candidatus Manganitrophus noduliformans]NKE69410.1 translocation/assembly module TamB [Candidatus Manganitrophus noduliformans]